jgi:class 3 adenylate cyclase
MSFKSNEFAWKDLTIFTGGRRITGVRNVEYTTSRTVEMIYGAGVDPHSANQGNKEYTGTITVLQSELEAMTEAAQAAGYDDITDLFWDLTVNYSKGVADKRKTDQLVNVAFTEIPKGMAQGDSSMEVPLAFVCGKINYNQ